MTSGKSSYETSPYRASPLKRQKPTLIGCILFIKQRRHSHGACEISQDPHQAQRGEPRGLQHETQNLAHQFYIYESLTNQDISRAMEEEFDRVESMMFIRVPKTDASGQVKKDPGTGEAMVEVDGC